MDKRLKHTTMNAVNGVKWYCKCHRYRSEKYDFNSQYVRQNTNFKNRNTKYKNCKCTQECRLSTIRRHTACGMALVYC